jgi:GT2 family glycosyltransferase
MARVTLAPKIMDGAALSTPTAFEPIRVLELELADELPRLDATASSGSRHRRALVLVRLHSRPLGMVELVLRHDGCAPTEYAPAIWRALSADINRHLLDDGLEPVSQLTAGGLRPGRPPRCVEARERALADAPFVSVIVATRDGTERLADCLDSLQRLAYPSYEIIVVDNAPSTGATRELIAARDDGGTPRVHYVHAPSPGLAEAHNRGLDRAHGTIVAFTDDDVIADRLWLLELVRGFDGPHVACVTGMILPAELETQAQVWLEQYGGFAKGFAERVFDLSANRPPAALFPYTAGALGSGANMAFRTDVLRRMGGFDPSMGAGTRAVGGDDLAAFFDVIAAGHTLAYVPAALVYHRHRRDYESLQRQAYSYGVGLTAYLAKTVLDRPARIFHLAWLLPRGLAHLVSPSSPKNANKRADYPRELTRLERRGMLSGPAAYVRARRESRALGRRRAASAPAPPRALNRG